MTFETSDSNPEQPYHVPHHDVRYDLTVGGVASTPGEQVEFSDPVFLPTDQTMQHAERYEVPAEGELLHAEDFIGKERLAGEPDADFRVFASFGGGTFDRYAQLVDYHGAETGGTIDMPSSVALECKTDEGTAYVKTGRHDLQLMLAPDSGEGGGAYVYRVERRGTEQQNPHTGEAVSAQAPKVIRYRLVQSASPRAGLQMPVEPHPLSKAEQLAEASFGRISPDDPGEVMGERELVCLKDIMDYALPPMPNVADIASYLASPAAGTPMHISGSSSHWLTTEVVERAADDDMNFFKEVGEQGLLDRSVYYEPYDGVMQVSMRTTTIDTGYTVRQPDVILALTRSSAMTRAGHEVSEAALGLDPSRPDGYPDIVMHFKAGETNPETVECTLRWSTGQDGETYERQVPVDATGLRMLRNGITWPDGLLPYDYDVPLQLDNPE